MLWVFRDFINPLISSNFYATEAEGRGGEVHYYRKYVWMGLLRRAQSQLSGSFVRISGSANDVDASAGVANTSSRGSNGGGGGGGGANNAAVCINTSSSSSSSSASSGPSPTAIDVDKAALIRFVPKKSSLRSITNLRTRTGKQSQPQPQSTYGTEGGIVTNAALYSCLHVLKHKFDADPALAGEGAIMCRLLSPVEIIAPFLLTIIHTLILLSSIR